ncbi:OB-fold nucleic acid binding domain-containing protein [Mumia sp. Pv 4-285]|uniref:OB-fold nucleic acid binding domain-containing protein n=1 Tax=Mumia qirimensis TaxID=3234852 RepID=UPI00351D90F7
MSPTSGTTSLWSRTRERMSDLADREDDAQLREEAVEAGCRPVCDQRIGEVVTVHGEIRAVTYRPRSGARALEALLYDGSGALTLVWIGRTRIAGIEAGRSLTATGRLGVRDGGRVLYNPRYELCR